MKIIAEITYDKDWWISVVVAGLIVSVAAAYLKDGVSLALKKTTELLTLERRKRRRNKARRIIFLSEHRTLIVVNQNIASAGMNRTLGIVILAFTMPILAHTMRLHPEWTFGLHLSENFDPMIYYKWIFAPFSFLCPILAYSYLDDMHIAHRAAWHEAIKKSRTRR